MKKQFVGKHGEDTALTYLQSKGYKFHDRNVRLGHDEIDLIVFDPSEKSIVFAEVKTRARIDPDFPPEANLTPTKKERMRRAAKKWIDQKEYDGSWRLDLISVIGNSVTDHISIS